MSQSYLDGRVIVHAGDCLEILKTLPENSVDSICTDPPYHLTSIVRQSGKSNLERDDSNLQLPTNKGGGRTTSPYKRVAGGFMGKSWDGGDIAFQPSLWAEVLRVLKPGGYICAFGGCRTYHRMACAIEDAGFITHPMIAWVFGQGFGKGKNLSKQIDLEAGVERQVVGAKITGRANAPRSEGRNYVDCASGQMVVDVTASATDAACQWDGWFYGTQSLKPALEPIYLGQKPFSEKTGAQNVLRWNTGALNIGACKIGAPPRTTHARGNVRGSPGHIYGNGDGLPHHEGNGATARWPANLLHDGSAEVLACFPESTSVCGFYNNKTGRSLSQYDGDRNAYGKGLQKPGAPYSGDSGSAARFFASFPQDAQRLAYCAKAGPDDRLGSKHPTVKPLKLLQYLCRLITPQGGTILDCFAGTGTTAEAAYREGFNAVLIEREAEYLADIERRMSMVASSKQERKQASAKVRIKPIDAGPLFEAAE